MFLSFVVAAVALLAINRQSNLQRSRCLCFFDILRRDVKAGRQKDIRLYIFGRYTFFAVFVAVVAAFAVAVVAALAVAVVGGVVGGVDVALAVAVVVAFVVALAVALAVAVIVNKALLVIKTQNAACQHPPEADSLMVIVLIHIRA